MTEGQKVAQWNGEPCIAETGSVICGESHAPQGWSKGREGERMRCVRVRYHNDPMFLYDEHGVGSRKVFEEGGSPHVGHANIPVDDLDSFIPDKEQP